VAYSIKNIQKSMTNSNQSDRINKDGKLTLTFCGGVGSVTGANFLLTGPDGLQILVDCGLEQGTHDSDLHNHQDFIYMPYSFTESVASSMRHNVETDIKKYEADMVEFLKTKHSQILKNISEKKTLDDTTKKQLVDALIEFKAVFQPSQGKK
jgi:hypothetical protein